jgi:hypothetical protein
VILNGHEWVERQAKAAGIEAIKEENVFIRFTDGPGLGRAADTLRSPNAIGLLARAVDRWIYSACLCFGLSLAEQEQSGFRYEYSVFQAEYSRNLLFRQTTVLQRLYQPLIDRVRNMLSVNTIKMLFGRKRCPYRRRKGVNPPTVQVAVERPVPDLTVMNVEFGNILLRIYDKGGRVLRIEATTRNARKLGCGNGLDKLPAILDRLASFVSHFMDVLHAAQVPYLDVRLLEDLPKPTQRGKNRIAGVNLQNPRMRFVVESVMQLAGHPDGFTVNQLAAKVRENARWTESDYNSRRAAYDLKKLRAKHLVERVENTRKYEVFKAAFRHLAAYFILQEEVVKPIAASVGRSRQGQCAHKRNTPEYHRDNLRREMRKLFKLLGIAA